MNPVPPAPPLFFDTCDRLHYSQKSLSELPVRPQTKGKQNKPAHMTEHLNKKHDTPCDLCGRLEEQKGKGRAGTFRSQTQN